MSWLIGFSRGGICVIVIFTQFLLWIATGAATCIGNITKSELIALESLYLSTNGQNWHWKTSQANSTSQWVYPATIAMPCSARPWQGVDCVPSSNFTTSNNNTNSSCHVGKISLANSNLVGYLPSELQYLRNLTVLSLAQNQLTSSIPIEFYNLTNLQFLVLAENSITGTISHQIIQMNQLQYFIGYKNQLSRSLPFETFELSRLIDCELYDNLLTGSVSVGSFAASHSLQTLTIDYNFFTNSIISEFGNAIFLEKLQLNTNYFTSTLSSNLGKLKNLTLFQVDTNLLTSSIPSELCNLQQVQLFYVYLNSLTGSIPIEIGQMNQLTEFGAYNNQLNGTIPSQFGQLSQLELILVSFNELTGIIPIELTNATALNFIYMSSNLLFGTIPTEIGKLSNLTVIDLSQNSLIGSIPIDIFALVLLTELNVANNMLSGSFPTQLSQLTLLQTLKFDSNLFSGTIFSSINSLKYLQMLSFSQNYISGEFPSNTPMKYIQMKSFSIASNFISGTISSDIRYLNLLEYLNISSNLLSGSISDWFDSEISSLASLVYFDVSTNALTGTIPIALFTSTNAFQYLQSRQLTTLVLYRNCFSGSLPTEICELNNLTTLILDSITSAEQCSVRFPFPFNRIFHAFIGQQGLVGDVPSCLFALPQLISLHLSGNGITGSLVELSSTSGLIDVSLASNILTGTIPLSWQIGRQWQMLDLSGNKLMGTLSNSFLSSSSLAISSSINSNTTTNNNNSITTFDLTINRLSGSIPTSFRSIRNINILDGNLFQCSPQTKPIYDPLYNEYVCGSDDFNDALIFYGCTFGSILVTLLLCYLIFQCNSNRTDNRSEKSIAKKRSYHFQFQRVFHLFRIDNNENYQFILLNCMRYNRNQSDNKDTMFVIAHENLLYFISLLRAICQFSLVLIVLILIAPMLTYIGMKQQKKQQSDSETAMQLYSTHTEQYLWVTSVAFLHGLLPVLLLLLYLFVAELLYGLIAIRLRFPTDFPGSNVKDIARDVIETAATTTTTAIVVADKNNSNCNSDNTSLASNDSISNDDGNAHSDNFRNSNNNNIRKSFDSRHSSAMSVSSNSHRSPTALRIISNTSTSAGTQLHSSESIPSDLSPVPASVPSRWIDTASKYGAPVAKYSLFICHLKELLYSLQPLTDTHNTTTTTTTTATAEEQPRGFSPSNIYCLRLPSHVTHTLVFVVVHMIITVSVNVAYVIALLSQLEANVLFCLQVAMSLFKISWNNIYISYGLNYLSLSYKNGIVLATLMLLFTFIASPVIATFFSDSTCFRLLITGQSPVQSSFAVESFECSIYCVQEYCVNLCGFSPITLSQVVTSVVPSWSYSFQCSSSLLENYSPVLLFSFTISGLIFPFLKFIFVLIDPEMKGKYLKRMNMDILINQSIYAYDIRKPIDTVASSNKPEGQIKDDVNITSNCNFDNNNDSNNSNSIRSIKLFNSVHIISQLLLNVGVLLTFGLANPLLGIVVAVDTSSLWLLWSYLISRYVKLYQQQQQELQPQHHQQQSSERVNCHAIVSSVPTFESSSSLSSPLVTSSNSIDAHGLESQQQSQSSTFLNSNSSGGSSSSNSSNNSRNDAALYALDRATKELSLGYPLASMVVILFIGIFWGLFIFDMVGDVFGAVDGSLAVLIPFFGGIVIYVMCMICNEWKWDYTAIDANANLSDKLNNRTDNSCDSKFYSVESVKNPISVDSIEDI